MSLPPAPAGEESLRDLLGRVIDNMRAYLRAEIALIRTRIGTTAGKAAAPVALFVIALLVVQACLTVLVIALGAWLATCVGWPAGLALAGLIGLALAGLLGWIGYRRLTGAFK